MGCFEQANRMNMNPTTTDTERAAFEAWWKTERQRTWDLLCAGRGPEPASAWSEGLRRFYEEGWMARASLLPQGTDEQEGDEFSAENLIHWLEAKYSRHREYEDKAAADMLRRLSGKSISPER